MVKTTSRWKAVAYPLAENLQVAFYFGRVAGQVQEFKVVLHTESGGPDEWLVRIETHGGRPHKHVVWDDEGEARHKGLKGWPVDRAQILSQAIRDITENWPAYQGRY